MSCQEWFLLWLCCLQPLGHHQQLSSASLEAHLQAAHPKLKIATLYYPPERERALQACRAAFRPALCALRQLVFKSSCEAYQQGSVTPEAFADTIEPAIKEIALEEQQPPALGYEQRGAGGGGSPHHHHHHGPPTSSDGDGSGSDGDMD